MAAVMSPYCPRVLNAYPAHLFTYRHLSVSVTGKEFYKWATGPAGAQQ